MILRKDWLAYFAVATMLVGGFVLSFISHPFGESGGINVPNITLIAVATLLFFFIAIKSKSSFTIVPLPRYFVGLFFLLILFFLIEIYPAYNTYHAIFGVIRWTTSLLIFYSAALYLYKHPEKLKPIGAFIVYSAAFLALVGLYLYAKGSDGGRLSSLLAEHNVFAGLLLIPLGVSVALLYQKETLLVKILHFISATLIISAFFLTFSRGAWLSLFLAIVITAFWFRNKFSWPTVFKSNILSGLIISIIVVTSGIYLTALYVSHVRAQSFTVYGGETVPTTATLDRLYYFNDAFHFIKTFPWGVGLDNYPVIAQNLRSHVVHFSFSAHNTYLQMMVEIGIFGGILFSLFIAWLLYMLSKKLKQYTQINTQTLLPILLFCGILATLIHWAMDADSVYTTNICFFFLSSGALLGFLLSQIPKEKEVYSPTQIWVLGSVMVVLALFTLPFYLHDITLGDAIYFTDKQQYSTALNLYQKAQFYFPYDQALYVGRSSVYDTLALASSNPTEAQYYFHLATDDLQQALRFAKTSSSIFDAQSRLYQQLGDTTSSIEAESKAVANDPLNNLDRHVRLMTLYAATEQYDKAIAVADTVTQNFPPSIFGSYEWADPSQGIWRDDIIQLLTLESAIYKMQKNQGALATTTALMNKYRAQISQSPQ